MSIARVLPPQLDEAMLAGLLAQSADELRRYVATRIPANVQAVVSVDDVIQETWIAAFNSRAAFAANGPRAFERWLKSIANRRLLDAMKTATRAKRGGRGAALHAGPARSSSFSDLFAFVLSPERTPSRNCAGREAERALELALSNLPAERRAAVRLHYFEGLSRSEIAARLAISEAAVNTHIFCGVRAMRVELRSPARFFSDVRSTDGRPDCPGR